MPAADERLGGVGLGELAGGAEGLGDARELGGRGDVADHEPAGLEGGGGLRRRTPTGPACRGRPGRRCRRGRPSASSSTRSPTVTVQFCGSAPKKLTTLPWATSANSWRRSNDARRPSGPIARSSQSDRAPGPDAGLDDGGAGEDVGEGDDLGGVLRVDDGGAAGHRHDEVAQQRAEGEVLVAGRARDDRAVGQADEVVVGDHAAVRVEHGARGQHDGVHLALGAGELDLVALEERAGLSAGGAHGGCCSLSGPDRGRGAGGAAPRRRAVRSRRSCASRGASARGVHARAGRPGATPTRVSRRT